MSRLIPILLAEWRTLLTNRRVAVLVLIGPFLYGILFGAVYQSGRVQEERVTVIDYDQSPLSRRLIQALDASDSLRVLPMLPETGTFREQTYLQQSIACIIIPAQFERTLMRGRQARVLVQLDSSNNMTATVAWKAIKTVTATLGTGVRIQRSMRMGTPASALRGGGAALAAQIRPLFNPTYNYAYFLVYGLVCIALHQVCMMSAVLSLGLSGQRSHDAPLVIEWFGRSLAHTLLATPLAWLALLIPFGLLGQPFRGDWLPVLWTLGVFMALSVQMGYAVLGMCRGQVELALLCLLTLSVPLFTLSGATWPVFAMPAPLQTVSGWLPLTHVIAQVRAHGVIGVSSDYGIAHPVVWIWLICAVLPAVRAVGISRQSATMEPDVTAN